MRKKQKHFVIAGIVITLGIALLVAVVLFRDLVGTGHERLPVVQLAASPRSFAGNIYSYEGHIDSQVGYLDGVGRMILTQDVNRSHTIPLFVRHDLTGFNPNVGQLYRFVVSVDSDGCLTVQSFKKL
jgi:hypothetical protein